MVILVGGGTQINRAFEEAGLKPGKHGPLGRETNSFKERQLARDTLEYNQAELQDLLASKYFLADLRMGVRQKTDGAKGGTRTPTPCGAGT